MTRPLNQPITAPPWLLALAVLLLAGTLLIGPGC
jgi:hypothetical protein